VAEAAAERADPDRLTAARDGPQCLALSHPTAVAGGGLGLNRLGVDGRRLCRPAATRRFRNSVPGRDRGPVLQYVPM